MRRPVDLRSRVLVWFVLLVGASLAAASFLLFSLFTAYQRQKSLAAMAKELVALQSHLWAGPIGQNPEDAAYAYLERWSGNESDTLIVWIRGRDARAAGPLLLEGKLLQVVEQVIGPVVWWSGPRSAMVPTPLGPALVLAQPLIYDGVRIGAAGIVHPTAGDRAVLLRALGVLVAAVITAFLIGSYLAWISLGRLLRPLDGIAQTMREIAQEGDLTRRIPVHHLRGELGVVGEAFNRMLDRLQASLERERRFLREISHELRTPITICRGHLEVLGTRPSEQELAETIAVVVDELDRMARLVDDLTTLARAEDPEFLKPREVPVGAFLADVASKALPLLDGRLRVVPPQEDGLLWADPHRLTQALLNLLQNAAVHTPPGTPVELRAVRSAQGWRFEVRDEGPGLPPGVEEAVFRPFYRANPCTPGSGLGLTIVQAIAKAHGGRAGVDSQAGQGATFWIELP